NCTFSQQPEAANPGANAFDGNSSTLWSSQNQAYVVIDLGATTGITCVGVQFKLYEDSRTIPYSIYVSDDNSSWTQVFNGSSVALSNATLYATVNQNARYVKVQFEGNTVSGWSSVTEIEVYSGTVVATAATATSTATSSSFSNLSSVSGNFVLNVQGTSNVLTVGSDGTLSVSAYVSGNANQIWTKVGNVVTNTGTGQALDVYNESYESGSEVGVWEANGGSNQNWSFVNKSTYYLIQSSMSSLYLTVSSSGQMQQKGESSATKWIVSKAS
ncbi:MAG: discoidin domain-containing protein, partial [Clostridia bacterium]|nr:discoidin domain-containing protein [Clostridia bacterium]